MTLRHLCFTRIGRLVLGCACTLVVALIVATNGHGGRAAAGVTGPADNAKLTQSAALATESAPPLRAGPGSQYADSVGDIRAAAAAYAQKVPLPDGGNFNGIQWENGQYGLPLAIVQAVEQFNAACQWYRAAADGREVATAQRIIADIPQWSSFREPETHAKAVEAAQDFSAGGGGIFREQLKECDASAQRERDYASAQGSQPSR
jgi:hypothetical protein